MGKNGIVYTTKVTILTVYHKRSFLLAGEDVLPVNAGRAVALPSERVWLEKHTVSDATGDNISAKNPSYNELTALYWAWKNLSADYFGLMHYRRFFRFSGGRAVSYTTRERGDKLLSLIGYTPDRVRRLLSSCDFIAPKPVRRSVYRQYAKAHDEEDLAAVGEIVKRSFPSYYPSFRSYVNGKESYLYNMFLFDESTFHRYCAFLFGVLSEAEERFEGKRMYVSERLTGAFITQLLAEGKKGVFLPVVHLAEKQGLKNALLQTIKNVKNRNGTSFLYACKPILYEVLPSFFFTLYRNRR